MPLLSLKLLQAIIIRLSIKKRRIFEVRFIGLRFITIDLRVLIVIWVCWVM